MALSIKNPEAERLAKQLARQSGTSVTEAVITALREKLKREQGRRTAPDLAQSLLEIGRRLAEAPVLDDRSPDEILGYDEHGLPR